MAGIEVSEPAVSVSAAKTQAVALWTVPVFGVAVLTAFLVFPGFFPPMSPQLSAVGVADFYRRHLGEIRFSMVTFNLFGVMLAPFFGLVAAQMMRMSTPSKVLAFCYLTTAASGATIFALADLFWLLAAFRPERNPDLIMLLNDLAWIVFVAPVGMFVVQNLCLALAVHLDDRAQPVFPRWVAPFNLVIAAAITPAACAAVVRTGPLAWNGVVSFWLRFVALGLYVAVMFFVLRRAINRQGAEDDAHPSPELVR